MQLTPCVLQMCIRDRLHGLGRFARQVQHGRDDAGIGAPALEQRAEDELQDVADLAQELARRLGRLRGRVLQHHRQVVGQFAFAQEEPRRLVGLDQMCIRDRGRG